MKVLITGGAGFIGSHLAEALLLAGHEVSALDDLSTGSTANIKTLNGRAGFTFIEGTMMDEKVVQNLMASVEGCFHLGAALGVKRILERPYQSLVTNMHGTEIVLQAAADRKVRTFLASTSELYGKNPEQPLTEDSDRVIGSPQLLRWTYSEAKAIDESLAQIFHQSHGLPYVTGRFFNTVGPRQTGAYGMVLPGFVKASLSGAPLTVYGDGEQQRVFCHVSDAVDAVMRLFFDEKTNGQAFNIGGEEEVSIRALAERVIAQTDSKSTIEMVAYKDAYPAGFEETMRRVPDTTKLRRWTGWKPTYSLDAIIEDVASYMKDL